MLNPVISNTMAQIVSGAETKWCNANPNPNNLYEHRKFLGVMKDSN